MSISINVKSGTGGYYDEDGCDLCLREIADERFPIPRIGETIELWEDNEKHEYLVTDVKYWISDTVSGIAYGVIVYVIPIGRKL